MILYNPTVSGSLLVTGSLTTTGTITSQTLVVQTITSSIEFNTGSTRNGTLSTNTHEFTGSVNISGSARLIGNQTISGSLNVYEPLTNSTSYLTIQNNRARNAAVLTQTSNGGFYAGTSIGTDTFNYQIYDAVAGEARLTIASTGAATFQSVNAKTNTGNWHQTIFDTSTMATGVGGGISFCGNKATSTLGLFAAIDGYKENATSANELGGFRIWTSNGTNLVERMRITSGGVVYINTTTNPLPDNAAPQLGILAGASTDAINVKHTQNGNNTFNIWQTGATSHNAIAFYKGDTQTSRGLITVTTSGTTYNSVSDYRLKENIVPLENGIDRLMQLKPSKFNWIETGNESEGFIAHELQEIFPDAVTGEKDAIYSSTGNIKPQSVDYGRITPLLVRAIQEQQAKITALEEILQRNNIQ